MSARAQPGLFRCAVNSATKLTCGRRVDRGSKIVDYRERYQQSLELLTATGVRSVQIDELRLRRGPNSGAVLALLTTSSVARDTMLLAR